MKILVKLKNHIKTFLEEKNIDVIDKTLDGAVDFVDSTVLVANEVKEMIGDFQECLKAATKVTKVVTGVVDTAKKVVGTLQQKEQLDDAKKESLEAREQDEEARIKAEEALTEEERKYVDLPAPDGPTIITNSPFSMGKLILSTAFIWISPI